jgi:formylmethanofuran dehydrogenase subunit E
MKTGENLKSLNGLLDSCMENNGHSCPGQVLGVRMAMVGLSLIGITDPKGSDRKNIMVIVEQDRCATDAIQYVTGCSLGKRTLKCFDYGKMAATFINVRQQKAVRVVAREEARETARRYFPDIEDKYKAQAMAYRIMSDEELFKAMDVEVVSPLADYPVKTSTRAVCHCCGEHVEDKKQVVREGKRVCRSCADGPYYTVKNEVLNLPSAPAIKKA